MIKKFFVDKARYFAIDEKGNKIFVEIDYWNNDFEISEKNEVLEKSAKKFLKNKHKINFSHKLVQ